MNYRIYRSNAGGGPYAQVAQVGPVTAYQDTGLPSGATWFYRVTAMNDDGESAMSGEAGATTFTTAGPPQNLDAFAGNGAGEIALSWEPPIGNPVVLATSSFEVQRAPSAGGPYEFVANTTALEYRDSGRMPGASYWYRVRAWNAIGAGALSQIVEDMAPARLIDIGLPSTPTTIVGPLVVGNITMNLNLACLHESIVPSSVANSLVALSPVPVGLAEKDFGPTQATNVTVSYAFGATQLTRAASLPGGMAFVCSPLRPNASGVTITSRMSPSWSP